MKAIVVYYIDITYDEFEGVDVEQVMVFSDEEFTLLNEQDINSLVAASIVTGKQQLLSFRISL